MNGPANMDYNDTEVTLKIENDSDYSEFDSYINNDLNQNHNTNEMNYTTLDDLNLDVELDSNSDSDLDSLSDVSCYSRSDDDIQTKNTNNNTSIPHVKKPRRKHKNSRNGCLICKQRKIKCDEKLPSCSFCEKRGIQCSYLTMTPFQIHKIEKDRLNRKKRNEKNKNSFKPNQIQGHIHDNNLNENCNDYNDSISQNKYNNLHEINLNNDPSLHTGNSVYKAHEMEDMLLPSSINNTTNHLNHDDSRLSVMINNYQREQQQFRTPNNSHVPLSDNAKISGKIFVVDKKYLSDIETAANKAEQILEFLHIQDFQSLTKLLRGKNVDAALVVDYYHILSISQIFDNLLRKSFLLYAMDFYKNILLKQQIFSKIFYQVKITISSKCENESAIFIDEITKMIRTEYLPSFHTFSYALVNLFTGSFLILNDCLALHFKNGLKYDLTYDESNRSVKLVGIFLTGLYSITMEKSRQEVLMSGTNFLSAHLISNFKKLLVPNYNIKTFDDFKSMVDKLSLYYVNDVNHENLKSFCEKFSRLLKINRKEKSLLGFNNGFLLRISNSFISIFPFDVFNLTSDSYQEKIKTTLTGKERDLHILTYLCFCSLGYILSSIMPGMENIASTEFASKAWSMFNVSSAENTMKLFKMIENKEMKLIAIYFIRTGTFFKNRRIYYHNYLMQFKINDLLDESSSLTLDERYLTLKKFKLDGVMDELQVRTFLLNKGQFFKKWNYPNMNKYKPKREDKVSINKIKTRFRNENNNDDLIADFINNNNGFFSFDYDATKDLAAYKSLSKDISFIDGFEMKVLWKLCTYIRINNL